MAARSGPIAPNPHITPQMVLDARRCLGACHQTADKIATFKVAGMEFPEQEQLNNDMRAKAEALLAYAAQLGIYSEPENVG